MIIINKKDKHNNTLETSFSLNLSNAFQSHYWLESQNSLENRFIDSNFKIQKPSTFNAISLEEVGMFDEHMKSFAIEHRHDVRKLHHHNNRDMHDPV